MEVVQTMRLITLAVVMLMTGMQRETVYKLTRQGKFPKPVKRGRSTRWIEKEVVDWIEALPRAQLGAADCCGVVGPKPGKKPASRVQRARVGTAADMDAQGTSGSGDGP